MEFQDFWREKERMCKSVVYVDCPFRTKTDTCVKDCDLYISQNPKEAEQIVEKWAKEHPVVTNGMKFMEIFGETFCSNMLIGSANEWWHTEYQPPKGEEG